MKNPKKVAAMATGITNQRKGDFHETNIRGHFGSDISMKEKGEYKATLTVETEKTEKVEFSFGVKN